MMPGYQASDSENAYDCFFRFFFQSDRPTQYQETHSTVNKKKKKKGGGGWGDGIKTFHPFNDRSILSWVPVLARQVTQKRDIRNFSRALQITSILLV